MSALHVVFKVAGSEYALPAGDVLQMETYTGATQVPGSKPWVAGIVQVRGRIVPVVDLRARFGLPAAERTLDSRVVVATFGDRAVALLVDAAREVIKLDEAQLKPPPEIVSQEARGMVKAVAQVGQRLVMLLDFAKVIGEE
jgi:purine-binding chemotaxis protein CheW